MRTWDVVVVGGGSAGSVVAARLSQDGAAPENQKNGKVAHN